MERVMSEAEHKSIKEVDADLAKKAEQLEKAIEEAEAKHPSLASPLQPSPNSDDVEAKPE
jgi:hypothetical protein